MRKVEKIFTLLLIFILLPNCGKEISKNEMPEFLVGLSNVKKLGGFEEPLGTIQLLKQHTFGKSDSTYLSSINDLAVDVHGRLYLSNNAIDVYKPDGSYLRSIGRKGSGPSEFQTIHNFKIRNHQLYVYDANLSRISIFDLDTFDLATEIVVPIMSNMRGMGEFAISKNGSLILGMEEIKSRSGTDITDKYVHYFFMDKSGQVQANEYIRTKWASSYKVRTQSGTSYPPIPFDRTTKFTISQSGNIYFAWSGSIAIKIFDSTGGYTRGFYYPFANKTVNSKADYPPVYHVLDIISETEKVLGDALPKTHPAIEYFFVDDNERIWLATIVAENGIRPLHN